MLCRLDSIITLHMHAALLCGCFMPFLFLIHSGGEKGKNCKLPIYRFYRMSDVQSQEVYQCSEFTEFTKFTFALTCVTYCNLM